ncbi:MAG: sialidase family protein [Bryobacteraceae bacterium]
MHALLSLVLAASIQAPNAAFRQPQLAAGDGQVVLTFGAEKSIYFASSSDQGKTFSKPVKIAEAGALALGRHRGPRATFLKGAILVSAVIGAKLATGEHAHGLPEAGDLTLWRSVDRGKTWAKYSVVNDAPGSAREGFHSIAVDAQGALTATWLDLRTDKTQIYAARSTDGGRTWSKNTQIYASPSGSTCECCGPSVVTDAGNTWIMFRNSLNGSRDMYVTRSANGQAYGAPQKSGTGTWKINACPMDGGGMVMDHGQPVSAWRRDKDVFLAPNGKPETKLGSGHDIAVVSTPKGVYVAWTGDHGLEIRKPGSSQPVPLNPTGAFVSLAALPDGSLLAAWEHDGAIQTTRVEP